MSKYKVKGYTREVAPGTGKPCIVALVEEKGVKQPFPLMLENVSSSKEAKVRMEEYIKMREADDSLREKNAKSVEEEENLKSVLNELNNS